MENKGKKRFERTLEALDLDVGNEGVHGLGALLVLVALAREADANAGGDAADTLAPDELVELNIDADVASAHVGLGELLDLLQRTGSAVLEATVRLNVKRRK